MLKSGDNVLSVYLGNGWYRQTKRTAEGHLEFGNKLIARFSLRYVDEQGCEREILSDGTESGDKRKLRTTIFFTAKRRTYGYS